MKTLFATILLSACLFIPSQSYARPEITVMEPVADRDERQVSIDEVRENIRSQNSDAAATRSEEREAAASEY